MARVSREAKGSLPECANAAKGMLEVDGRRLVVWRLRTGFSIRLAFRPAHTDKRFDNLVNSSSSGMINADE
jgi:hypothetical protein